MSVPKYISSPCVYEMIDTKGAIVFKISGVAILKLPGKKSSTEEGLHAIFTARPVNGDINAQDFIIYRAGFLTSDNAELDLCEVIKNTIKGEGTPVFLYYGTDVEGYITMTLLDGGDKDKIIAALVKEEMCKQ